MSRSERLLSNQDSPKDRSLARQSPCWRENDQQKTSRARTHFALFLFHNPSTRSLCKHRTLAHSHVLSVQRAQHTSPDHTTRALPSIPVALLLLCSCRSLAVSLSLPPAAAGLGTFFSLTDSKRVALDARERREEGSAQKECGPNKQQMQANEGSEPSRIWKAGARQKITLIFHLLVFAIRAIQNASVSIAIQKARPLLFHAFSSNLFWNRACDQKRLVLADDHRSAVWPTEASGTI